MSVPVLSRDELDLILV